MLRIREMLEIILFPIVAALVILPTPFLNGCMTIKPQITANHFRACEHLCRGNRGVSKMFSVTEVNYAGTTTVISEQCACKNNRTFDIIGSKD